MLEQGSAGRVTSASSYQRCGNTLFSFSFSFLSAHMCEFIRQVSGASGGRIQSLVAGLLEGT